jgi:hypothetical protein
MYRKALTAALAAALIIGIAACGPTQPKAAATPSAPPKAAPTSAAPVTPLQLVQASLDKTKDGKTAKADLSSVVSVLGHKETTCGTGVVQFDPSASSMTISGSPKRHEITIGSDSYEKKGSGSWHKVGADDASTGQGDPTEALSFVSLISDKVTSNGKKTIHGESTTGYNVTVNLDTAMATASAADKPNLENIRKSLGKSELPFQVWLDAKGRISRFEMSLPLTVEGHKVTSVTTLTLYAYGTPATITAPAV